ncbi:flagellar export chaperone FlgN [Roseimaritima ulvae]|uniref:FlgN protein n=1 Tax=Roseimaritima ulvae TaxID=980254 RepID=A0A5B9QT42_9BACT|nr:flagellar export chaperone FlgN [Roseimaritima ulvae]QEG42184.1 FlgN protein [Roseimaritima ulvae]
MTKWLDDLSEYLDQLEAMAGELGETVQTARSLTKDGAFASLHESTTALQQGLTELENLVEQRRRLLDRPDAPAGCYSLREALSQLDADADVRHSATFLWQRCQQIGQQIDQVREDALALFVCQYHLADTTSHFLRLLMPAAERSETYSPSAGSHQGGGLLDQAG